AEALSAFEKALAKNTRSGESVPELTALRAAVEAAAKKGENVEAVARELALIEKAVTGKAYERPKPAEPQADPLPPSRRPIRGGGVVVIGGGGNGAFTIKSRRGDVTYIVIGALDGDGAMKITIKDGDKTVEAEDVKKVPDDYRPEVERLLKTIGK
ncbi:MAG: hypothetical protein K2V38_00735, partial [Gemmataceae bacterium]|nr:hypothetical protein [Gemmataceae bacterium]